PILLPPPSRVFRLLRVRPSSCRAVLRVPAVQLLLRPVLRSVLTVLRSELLLLATPRLLTPVRCGNAADLVTRPSGGAPCGATGPPTRGRRRGCRARARARRRPPPTCRGRPPCAPCP